MNGDVQNLLEEIDEFLAGERQGQVFGTMVPWDGVTPPQFDKDHGLALIDEDEEE